MGVVISEIQYYAMIGATILIPLFTIIFTISIFKQVPWAWQMYKCYKNNLPYVIKHHAKGGADGQMPTLETELKDGVPHTFFRVDKWGIKLPDIAGDNTELFEGKVRLIHYYKNSVSPANIIDAVAIDRFKDWLNKKGVNIQNKEDIVLFFLNDYVKTKDIKTLIAASSVDDEETKKFIIKTIDIIEKHRSELEKLSIQDGVFVFSAAMMALDRTLAFTSAAFANAKSAIEAQVRAKAAEDKNKEMYRTVLIIFVGLICAAVAFAIIQKAGVLG